MKAFSHIVAFVLGALVSCSACLIIGNRKERIGELSVDVGKDHYGMPAVALLDSNGLNRITIRGKKDQFNIQIDEENFEKGIEMDYIDGLITRIKLWDNTGEEGYFLKDDNADGIPEQRLLRNDTTKKRTTEQLKLVVEQSTVNNEGS